MQDVRYYRVDTRMVLQKWMRVRQNMGNIKAWKLNFNPDIPLYLRSWFSADIFFVIQVEKSLLKMHPRYRWRVIAWAMGVPISRLGCYRSFTRHLDKLTNELYDDEVIRL